MRSIDSELKNWHDWTDPDFFTTARHRETRVFPLFLRQIVPASILRTRMTLTGWCLIIVSIVIGGAAYNTASNILFLALSLLLSSLILSGVLSMINFKKLDWQLHAPSHLKAGEAGIAEIYLMNRKSVFPSMSICFELESDMIASKETIYMQHALDAGRSCKLEWSFKPRRRGCFELRLAAIKSQFPFGFLQKSVHSKTQASVIIWPARLEYQFQASPFGQKRFLGASKKRLGQGSDLLNIRPYEPGDAPRLVHWRATARTGRLMIRQLAQEGESGYHLCINPDASIWSEEQFEQLCSLACSLGDDLFHQGRLESVVIGCAEPLQIRVIHDLYVFFDQLALLERQSEATEFYATMHKNQITFRSVDQENIAIYVDENFAGQTSD